MAADGHTPAQRGRAQGLNDLCAFGTVACASFFAGSPLHDSGWGAANALAFPAVALALVPLVWRPCSGKDRDRHDPAQSIGHPLSPVRAG